MNFHILLILEFFEVFIPRSLCAVIGLKSVYMLICLVLTPVYPVYSLVSLPLVIVSLYTPLSKHFPLKGHITLFLQFQSLGELLRSFRVLLLCVFIMLFMFGKQLYDNLMIFLLNILFRILVLGKYNFTDFLSMSKIFVVTFLTAI